MSIAKSLITLAGTVLITHALAGNVYLCGNNEDGCDLANPESCECVIKDQNQQNMHYCLNFHDDGGIGCDATKLTQQCPLDQDSYTDERTCAAIALQSEPIPACPEKTIDLCEANNITTVSASNLSKAMLQINN